MPQKNNDPPNRWNKNLLTSSIYEILIKLLFWGHSKSTFVQNFQFLTLPFSPLVHPYLFYMYPRVENQGVKKEKRINFFVIST